MNRGTALTLAFALLVAASLGLAAATLDTAVQPDAAAGGGVAETSDSAGDGRMDVPQPPVMVGVERDPCIEALAEPPAIAAILLALGLLFGYLRRTSGSTGIAAAVTAGAAVPTGTTWRYLTDCTQILPQDLEEEEAGPQEFASPENGSLFESAAGTATSSPTALAALFVVGMLALGVLALVLSRRGGDEETTLEPDDDADDADLSAARTAAGAAADRIDEGDDLDNEVYRAWRELADSLDVAAPDSSTPGEFARAAVEAGLDPEPVADLTSVFEEVRYGGADPTGDREGEAVDALRRIEVDGEEEDEEEDPRRDRGDTDDAETGVDAGAEEDR